MLFPFVWILEKIILKLNDFLWKNIEFVSKEDVEIFMEEWKKQWIFSSTESLIIHNLLEFRERQVDSVFTHRTDIFAVSEDKNLHEAVVEMLETPHSRIPLFKEDKDNIVWLITIREALRLYTKVANHTKKLKDFHFNTIMKVPVTASVFDVFLDMKKNGWHFAVVIDEYGGTAGIVTFEDVLEDLVWSIRDESDHAEEWEIIRIDESNLKVKAEVLLRDAIDALQINWFRIPEDLVEEISEEETMSYIILHQLKDFAKKGDIVRIGHVLLEVLRTNKTGEKIEWVKVTWEEEIIE